MSKRRQKEKASAFVEDEEVKPSKEECQIAKFLLGYLPEKEGKLHGMPVKIFIGEEAVSALLSEAYTKTKISKKIPIPDTGSAVSCLCKLMAKQMFHRAERVLKRKRGEKEEGDRPGGGAVSRKKRAEEKAVPNGTSANHEADEDTTGEGTGDKAEEKEQQVSKDVAVRPKKKEKKKRKIKLTMHEEQFFLNADEVYVWIYDPVRLKNVIGGIAMVVVTIACCLFPLWPNVLKSGAYYASIGGVGLFGLLVGIGILRGVLFVLLWTLSFGRHHFWLFPNFSEDCGVLESFQPIFSYEIRTPNAGAGEKASKSPSSNKTKEE